MKLDLSKLLRFRLVSMGGIRRGREEMLHLQYCSLYLIGMAGSKTEVLVHALFPWPCSRALKPLQPVVPKAAESEVHPGVKPQTRALSTNPFALRNPLFLPLIPALAGSPGGGRCSPVLSEGFLELEAQTKSTD